MTSRSVGGLSADLNAGELGIDPSRTAVADVLASLPNLRRFELPGAGRTIERLSALATTAAVNVSAARVVEPHVDALAILHEAGCVIPATRSWGVFAAEGPGQRLSAREIDGHWTLSGVKPWCSLGDRLEGALVTAHTGESTRRLFAVDLRDDRVSALQHDWAPTGLRDIDSGPLSFDGTPARPVGADDWYLERPGFEWGSIGVAAVWWGGAVPLCRAVATTASSKQGQELATIVGRLWQLMRSARLMLENAARWIDGESALSRDEAAVLAHETRGAGVDAVDAACAAVRDVMGAAALTLDRGVADRVADLQTYTSQYHRLREPAAIGHRLFEGSVSW
jgi:alkylation response protein AidB-like acyl-CoA dehydrogenase